MGGPKTALHYSQLHRSSRLTPPGPPIRMDYYLMCKGTSFVPAGI